VTRFLLKEALPVIAAIIVLHYAAAFLLP